MGKGKQKDNEDKAKGQQKEKSFKGNKDSSRINSHNLLEMISQEDEKIDILLLIVIYFNYGTTYKSHMMKLTQNYEKSFFPRIAKRQQMSKG